MGQIFSEGLEYIGCIDDNGYVLDQSGNYMAKINDYGYIGKIGGGKIYGKIDEDGTIRDSLNNVAGRIQADGYVYIHSKRVCKVSSTFIEKITPGAWNAGQPSTYSGRENTSTQKSYDYSSSDSNEFFSSPFFIKLVIGLFIGIFCMVNDIAGIEGLLGGPVLVFIISFFYKIFS